MYYNVKSYPLSPPQSMASYMILSPPKSTAAFEDIWLSKVTRDPSKLKE